MADSGIYAEDIVKNSQGNIGLVLQDAEGTSEDSDSEDETLKKGQILVCWYLSGKKETLALSKVKLADRSLLPGDVVKFADVSKGTQKGFVSNVEVIASIKVLDANQILHNVDCKGLRPLQELVPSVHVSMGPWLGLITEVYQKVVLTLENGSRYRLKGESSMLYDLSDQRDEDSPFYSATFYPGQKIAAPARAFKEDGWLSGTEPILHNQAQIKGTIEEANVISCDVDWQVCGACPPDGCHGEECLKPPEATVTQGQLHRLKVVNHFRHASLQIGNRAFYVLKNSDLASASNRGGSSKSTDAANDLEPDELNEETEHACTAMPSDSQTDDGEWKPGASDLSYAENAGAINGTGNSDIELSAEKGAVRKKDFVSAGASLSSDGSLDCLAPESELKHDKLTSTASVSDSVNPSVDTAANIEESLQDCSVAYSEGNENQSGSTHGMTNSVDQAAGSDSGDAERRVCVEVTNTCTTVDVIWQDGSKQEIIVSTDLIPVFHLDELEFFPGDYISDKRENAESSIYGVVLTTDHKSRLCHVKWFSREGRELSVERDVSVYDITEHAHFVFRAGDVVVRVAKSDENETAEEAVQKMIPCVGQVTIVDEEGFVFIRCVDDTVSKVKPQELYKVDTEDDGHASSNGSTVGSDDEWETAPEESSEEDQSAEIIGRFPPADAENTTGDESRNRFNELMSNTNPAFMMLETVPDGHANKSTTFQPENQRRFLPCVRSEMALLQTSLPDGIIVRGYEDRMDLMRVMITGPVDTPYEHGLFIFDVRLPPDYPASPPVFHYLSQCSGRLNPNLYEDGKVCVSLLGTWAGRGSERWTSKSNVLQVLVSIQGLILCNEPYYNEAGYEKQRGKADGVENSRMYNEMVLLKLVQSMERLVTRPPAGLENEILLHFVNNGARMIQKFKAWIDHHPTRAETVTAGCRNGESGYDRAAQAASELRTKEDQKQDELALDDSVKDADSISVENKTTVDCLSVTNANKDSSSSQDATIAGDSVSSVAETAEPAESQGACQGAPSTTTTVPDFPLFPLSRGFCLSLKRSLDSFNAALSLVHTSDITT